MPMIIPNKHLILNKTNKQTKQGALLFLINIKGTAFATSVLTTVFQ